MLARFSNKNKIRRKSLTKSVAIVGRGPNCGEFSIEEDLVAFHAELVGPKNLSHCVFVEEAVDNIYAEHVACTSSGKCEATVVLVGV